MANTRTKWTPEMIDRLHELRARNFTVLEIAEDMGLEFDVVKSKIKNENAAKNPKPKKPRERFKLAETPEAPQPQPEKPAPDPVNHPAHYTAGGVECIDAIKAAVPDFKSYCAGNVIKYVWRFTRKNGVEDLQKAEWYLHKLIEEESA